MDEKTLLEKFCLSKPELETLLSQLVDGGLVFKSEDRCETHDIRNIDAEALAHDIRTKLDQAELMKKYGLSFSALCNTVNLLLEGSHLRRSDLAGMDSLIEESLDPGATRKLERYYLDFHLPVVEVEGCRTEGRVRNLTEKGVGVTGIPATVDETKTLLIRHEKFALLKPFCFEARCRWVRHDSSRGETFAGFQITKIANEHLEQLKRMVRLLTFQLPSQGKVR